MQRRDLVRAAARDADRALLCGLPSTVGGGRSHECAEGAYIEEDQMSSDTMMFSDCLGLTANSTGKW
jgi:hypothetical protein